MTQVYLIRRWYHEGKVLCESAIGVASTVERAKEMASEAYSNDGKWKVTSWGVHSVYLVYGNELTINPLNLDSLEEPKVTVKA